MHQMGGAVSRWLRHVNWGQGYGWRSFRADLIAGLTVATVAVPQAMAYALIAGVEPRFGLYTAIVMTALGSLFGSSVYLINGPTNAISLVVLGAVAGLSANQAGATNIEVVGLLAILVGLIQVLIALFRLGDLTRYISESVVLGFMAGAGLLVALTQVHNLLGLEPRGTGEDHLLYRLWLTWTQDAPDQRPFAVRRAGHSRPGVRSSIRSNRRCKVRFPELLLSLVLVSFAVWLIPSGRAARDDSTSRTGCRNCKSRRSTRSASASSAEAPSRSLCSAWSRRWPSPSRSPPEPASRSTTTSNALPRGSPTWAAVCSSACPARAR